ncbi:hypothetical protein [Algoriphagus sp. PAP.12]|uniref:hypothetical protein n=1 Tax=Algoriphagus sp. PAP.12 TaxID=2996678 RepID=UPI00227C30B3|nr:hypothetical protein [Algoriphagus sp. PAP.12]
MRVLLITLFTLITFNLSWANEDDTKTFLVLFKSKELKSHQTNLKEIESQFSLFDTKTYSGNSELALLIEIPSCDFDECFLGDFLIDTGKNSAIKLQEIAFRLFDITESKKTMEVYLEAHQNQENSKRNQKAQ